MPETITHDTLVRLVAAGAVRSAQVVGQAGGWVVLVRYGRVEPAIAARHSRQVRLFRKLETLVAYLRAIGISSFAVDAADHEPDVVSPHGRPDRVAEHDLWFREQTAMALKEDGDPITNSVWASDEATQRGWDRKRAELAARLGLAAERDRQAP